MALTKALSGQLQAAAAPHATASFAAFDLARARECAERRALPAHAEAVLLSAAGRDRFGRQHWLQPAANRAWRRLRAAAQADGIELELVSSFRSVRDQARILSRKLAQGQSLEQILKVNAPPGYSEHHSGRALDLAVPGEALLTEAFEHSPAFAWLDRHGARFGFAMSYPRDNPCGFIYEPWHWCYHPGPSEPVRPFRG